MTISADANLTVEAPVVDINAGTIVRMNTDGTLLLQGNAVVINGTLIVNGQPYNH